MPAHPLLSASLLTSGTQQVVSNQWRKAVVLAAQTLSGAKARDIYCGRSFQEAVAASESTDKLWIISAGLGLVAGERSDTLVFFNDRTRRKRQHPRPRGFIQCEGLVEGSG